MLTSFATAYLSPKKRGRQLLPITIVDEGEIGKLNIIIAKSCFK
jgi:hypothetical protein